MGELIDYYLIESVVEYTDDPLKIGRVRCSIPGVIHHTTTPEKKALPWVRPFRMHGYQTYETPLKGQKVWVLVNKSNYNEFWWFPFYETIDIVQGYLNEFYDETPDVFHAREEFVSPIMATWDNKQGYKWVIGEDFIDFFPTRQFKLQVNTCNINVTDNDEIQVGGDKSEAGWYEPAVMGIKCKTMRENVNNKCKALAKAALEHSDKTGHLAKPFENLAEAFLPKPDDILCKKCHVN